MRYRTMLVQVDDASDAQVRFEVAVRLAQQMQAQLVGLAGAGTAKFFHCAVAADATLPGVPPVFIDTLRQRAARSLDAFAACAAALGADRLERRQTDAEPGAALCALSLYSDLTILSHYHEQARPDGEAWQLGVDIAVHCGGPVLLLPPGFASVMPPRRVLLAWNAGREARRALHYALLFLQRADAVDVAIFNPTDTGGHALAAAAEIVQPLRRHGVTAEAVQENAGSDVGKALLDMAERNGADLIVMGCYGHSRLREMLLGGVTRAVLAMTTIPVLMAA